MHIGLVEEDTTLVELLHVVFRGAHHTVTVLEHPHALELVLRLRTLGRAPLPYDLLIIDMPLQMQELDLLARLQEQIRPARLPVIVLTSFDQHAIEQARRAFPAMHFVQKPFHLIQLRSLIETASLED